MVAIGPDGTRLQMPHLLLEDDQARDEHVIGEAIHNNIAARRKRVHPSLPPGLG
jgi:hypothetical protein